MTTLTGQHTVWTTPDFNTLITTLQNEPQTPEHTALLWALTTGRPQGFLPNYHYIVACCRDKHGNHHNTAKDKDKEIDIAQWFIANLIKEN